MKKLAVFSVILVVSFSLFAFSYAGEDKYGGDGALIPLGSKVYDYMDALFIHAGKAIPSTSRPWTAGEARHELSRIEQESLSLHGRELYGMVASLLEKGDDGISLTVALNPEAYVHGNEAYDREALWSRGYEERNHLGVAVLESTTGGFQGFMEMSMGRGLVSEDDMAGTLTIKEYVEAQGKPWNGLGTQIKPGDDAENIYMLPSQANYAKVFNFNMPSGSNDDVNMPRRAYLDYTGSNYSIGIYKAQKSWGINRIGNFIFDDHNDYYNTLSLKTFSDRFNAEYTLMVPEQYRGGTNWTTAYEEPQKLFLAHRLEYRVGEKLSLAASENVMYQTKRLDLGVFNPAFFFHNNVNDRQFNALAHVEAEYTLAKGLLLYLQVGIDQGSFPGFEDPSKEDQAMGFSLGVKDVFFALDGLCIVSAEALATAPALYRPTNASDFIINYNQIYAGKFGAYSSYYRFPFYTYIGYEHGGDAVELRLDGDYYRNGLHAYSLLDVLLKGTYTMYDKYVKPLHRTILSEGFSTTVTFENGLEYESTLKAFPYKVFGDLALLWNSERGFDSQLSLGASLSYSL